jgi:predicted DsbA family dithiol-disulfide isomerase
MMGIQGVPAYIIDEKYLISGAQPYEVFEMVMREHVKVEPKK